MSASAIVGFDGRRQRALESRKRIIDALMALVREGELAPTAEAVALRSGVGLRTVFRLYSDMEALHREISAIMTARLLPMTTEPLKAASWPGRLEELARRRARIFEELLPFKRASDAHAARSATVRADRERLAAFQRQMLASIAPADFPADLMEALDLALSLDAWVRLRIDQRLSPERAHAVALATARALVAAARRR